MTIKAETGLSRSWSGEWEGKRMDPSLAARSMNRNIMWPKCLSTDNAPCVLCLSIFLIPLFLNLAVYFFFCLRWKSHRKGWTRPLSTAGGGNSVRFHTTHSKLLLPRVLDGEAITVVLGGTFKQKSRCDCVIWFHYLIPADQLTIWVDVLVSLSLFIFQLPVWEGCPCVDLWNDQFRLDEL